MQTRKSYDLLIIGIALFNVTAHSNYYLLTNIYLIYFSIHSIVIVDIKK